MADYSITASEVQLLSGPTEDGVAGGTITAGDAIYIKSSDGRAYRAKGTDGAAAEEANAHGIALHGASAGQPVRYAVRGAEVRLDSTAGTLANSFSPAFLGTSGALRPHEDIVDPNDGFASFVGMFDDEGRDLIVAPCGATGPYDD